MAERRTVIDMLTTAASKHPQWAAVAADQQAAIVRRLERGCYNLTIEECKARGIDRNWQDSAFIATYSQHIYRIAANIDPTSIVGNDKLLCRIINGDIDPGAAAGLPSEVLYPEALEHERREISMRQNQTIKKTICKRYRCKCGKSETLLREHQGRSADEASTIKAECIHCGREMRIQ